MKLARPSPAVVAAFDRALLGTGGERRQMFGCPCGFEAGRMFCGVYGATVFVRLAEAQREALLARGGRPFEPMPGRRMREYVVLPAATAGDPRALSRWMKQARAFAGTLPPKAPGPVRRKGRAATSSRRRPSRTS